MIVNRAMFPIQTGFQQITGMQQRLATLQVQLATGQKAASLAEMGNDRVPELAIRTRQSAIAGYQASIGTVELRLEVASQVMSRLDKIESEARSSAIGGAGSSGVNMAALPGLSRARLDEVLTLLNTDVAGRHLFGGGKTQDKPVAGSAAILDGENGRDGFASVANQRRLADLGDGLGRLGASVSGASVTLSEDGAHPFGFKLSTVSSTSAAVSLVEPMGTAQDQLSVSFAANPIAGETVSIALTLPDGSSSVVKLTAVTGAPQPGEFAIGIDAVETAQNFKQALDETLTALGKTVLPAASNFAAAENFFAGQGQPVLRVDGPPYETATALVAATAADTVLWYGGEDSAAPRQSVTARIDESTQVSYGVQANEHGIVELVRSLAAMAVETYPAADATAPERFAALADRQRLRLAESNDGQAGSLEVIGMELGIAQSTLGHAKERHTAYKAQLDTMLEELSSVTTEEVAMEMLALNTRLQASYQATAMVMQLSFVNYVK